MKKKALLVLLMILVLISTTACNNKLEKSNTTLQDALKFKIEYESFNGKNNEYFKYREVIIPENNPFIYSTADEIVKKIEENETFFVYFGDPECPWCRSIIEQATKIATEKNIEKIYYVRIWNGFHNEILRDTYELNSGQPALKNNGTNAYYKLLKYFDNVLKEYTLQDEQGNIIDIGEKRIFAPNFIYVKSGKAIKLIQGISEKQQQYNDELTAEIIKDEKNNFSTFYNIEHLCDINC